MSQVQMGLIVNEMSTGDEKAEYPVSGYPSK